MPQPADAPAVHEARLRAKLLHETIHGALQVMHRDFFRDGDQRLPIPSESLEDVFAELDKSWQVKIKWLAINAPAMNPTNLPQTPFDEAAVKAITDGASGYEEITADTFHYAGQVTLSNQCLKCHVPQRKSLEDRHAAVVISMPLGLVERTGVEATE